MAKKLTYSVGFDLAGSVEEAVKQGEVAINRIQNAMSKKPIVVKAEFDATKFPAYSKQISNSIDGINAKIKQAERLWNAMEFENVKFDKNGDLSRRAQVVLDSFRQLTGASQTMGRTLSQMTKELAKSEAQTHKTLLKGVDSGYVGTQKQIENVRALRDQYNALLPVLNNLMHRKVTLPIEIDKKFEPRLKQLNSEVARVMDQINNAMARGVNTAPLQSKLNKLTSEINSIGQQKIDLINNDKALSNLSNLKTQVAAVYQELQSKSRELANSQGINTALDAQSQKVLKLQTSIQALDQQLAQLNSKGQMYNADNSLSNEAKNLLQQRIALTNQLTQASVTGQQAQLQLERQIRSEEQQTAKEKKDAAREEERQAKAEQQRRAANRKEKEKEIAERRKTFEQKRKQWQEEQKILNKEAKSIDDITKKLEIQRKRLQSAEIGSSKFNSIAESVKRLNTQLDAANQKLATMNVQMNNTSHAAKTSNSYLGNLLQKMATYSSVQLFQDIIHRVREVTAQYELQRASLGAILQDQDKANTLFSKIQNFALQSPVSVLDLTTYTKQLAAYRIEYDELFETTKRLTDISVGLGVSMDRIILMYGQIRAAGYLRACLGKDTPVKMFDGSVKKVQCVQIGDLLMGDDERPRAVRMLHHGEQQMYRVIYDGGEFRCNEHHMLTVWNKYTQEIDDVYVFDVYGHAENYKAVRRINGKYELFPFELVKDNVDVYFGFSIDGNNRFIICDNIVTHNSELRQATEAGIPLAEALADKLSKVRGESISVAEVLQMISERKISFEMVKDVFNDMTSAGGIFFNMQEKQSATLYGMWAKLSDAIEILYNNIGSSGFINETMKVSIKLLTDIISNTGTAVRGFFAVVAVIFIIITRTKILGMEQAKVAAIQATYNARIAQANAVTSRNIYLTRAWTSALKLKAVALRTASLAANAFGLSLHAIRAALVQTGIGALVVALGYLIDKLFFTESAADKAADALKRVTEETAAETEKSVQEFNRLIGKVFDAPKGSNQQKEALEELQRTYKDMFPVEVLQIDYLQKLDGHYESLTNRIRAYIAEKQNEKAVEEVQNAYSGGISKSTEQIQTHLRKDLKMTEQEIADYMTQFKRLSEENYYSSAMDLINDALKASNLNGRYSAQEIYDNHPWFRFHSDSQDLLNLFNLQKRDLNQLELQAEATGQASMLYSKELKGLDESLKHASFRTDGSMILDQESLKSAKETADFIGQIQNGFNGAQVAFDKETGKFTTAANASIQNMVNGIDWQQVGNGIQNMINASTSAGNAEVVDSDSYLGDQMIKNFQIAEWIGFIKQGFQQAEIAWNDEMATFVDKVNASNPENISRINFNALKEKITEALNNPGITDAQRTFLYKLQTTVDEVKRRYDGLIPSNPLVNAMQSRFKAIANSLTGFSTKYNDYLMKDGETMKEYNKRLRESIDGLKEKIKESTYVMNRITALGAAGVKQYNMTAAQAKQVVDNYVNTVAVLDKAVNDMPAWAQDTSGSNRNKTKKSGTTKQDPRLQNLKEEISLTTKLHDEYVKLEKEIGSSKAKEKIQEIYANTIKTLEGIGKKYKFDIKVPFDDDSLKYNLRHFIDEMKKLQKLSNKKGKPLFPKIGSEIDNAVKQLEDIDLKALKTAIDKKLKALAEEVSRTKTAKDFYQKVFSATGDVDLSANLTFHLYGEEGNNVYNKIRKQLEETVSSTAMKLPKEAFYDNDMLNTTYIRRWAKENQKELGDTYEKVVKFADDAEKDFAKTIEDWLKDTKKIEKYADKVLNIANKTRDNIFNLNMRKHNANMRVGELESRGALSNDEQAELESLRDFLKIADDLIAKYKKKQDKDIADLEFDAFKETPMYTQIFDNLDKASTTMLTNMKARLEGMRDSWSNLDPTQLKELQDRLNEIDQQLATRNPFNTLVTSIQKYRQYRKLGDDNGNFSEEEANIKLADASAAVVDARKKYNDLVAKYGKDNADNVQEVKDAKDELDKAMTNETAAAKAVENWKKLKDMIGLSADEIFKMFDWAGSLAEGIATISEAMGADEEDVQYWNDISSALNNITSGIKDIVQSAMSGNIIGIVTSALSAIPKMIAGFAQVFAAGKIRKAEKEIKRQEKLIKELDYAYQRLQDRAEDLFGTEYLDNYSKQLSNLKAKQSAYLKQAEAERSKGKSAGKEKIKDYEDQARDTADEIAQLQKELVESFTGTSMTDVAKSMAESWFDARASMSDTFAAITSDCQSMFKNMIVQGAAARVIENALTPMWNEMDRMLQDNNIDGAIDTLINGMDSALNAANNGMEVLWQSLEAKGYDMKKLLSEDGEEYSGIAKQVSSATSEEINSNTTALNMSNYYMSTINDNVAIITKLLQADLTLTENKNNTAEWTDWQRQAMDNLSAIKRNTADTVTRCERAAIACEKFADKFSRVVNSTGATSGINVFVKKG